MPRPSTEPVISARVRTLAPRPARRGDYVLYWMQQSQRAVDNDALTFAIARANEARLPVLVGFGLMDGFPEANVRHYRFMLEGLRDVAHGLERLGVAFVLRRGAPDEVALSLAADAALVVCDRGYTRHQRRWRSAVADAAPCEVLEVEADVVVPVGTASDRREFAARTLRPKITARLSRMLEPPQSLRPRVDARALGPSSRDALDVEDLDGLLARLSLDRSVPAVSHRFQGGSEAALGHLRRFLEADLRGYADARANPARASVSHLAKHLHFGQISPVTVALAAKERRGAGGDRDAFLEELIVRRELAQNFVAFTEDYDRYETLPSWARATLEEHARDPRPHGYDAATLERAETHDPYFNAAMREMKYTGYMHNALRMYWGKKILEWSARPDEGYATALRLNNKYFLDGRDPNSYANIGWVFGLHDRPWPERPIFGKVRSMMASGLERKSDIGAYVAAVDRMVDEAQRAGVRFEAPARARA